jgi:hypothetical protein
MTNLDTKPHERDRQSHHPEVDKPGTEGPGGFSTINIRPRGHIIDNQTCVNFLPSEGVYIDLAVTWYGSGAATDSVGIQISLPDGTVIDPSEYSTYFDSTSPYVLPPTSVPFNWPTVNSNFLMNVLPGIVGQFNFLATADGNLSGNCCIVAES